MMIVKPLIRAHSTATEPERLIAQLLEQFAPLSSGVAGIFLFRQPCLDDDRLSKALAGAFQCPVASCTTAGEILDGYLEGSSVAIAFSSECFAFHQVSIPDLSSYDFRELQAEANRILEQPVLREASRFGVLLVDGLSASEETLVGQIYQAFRLPLIGGSAGDDLRFERTRVLCDGHYREGAATFTVVESLLPFDIFRVQHFEPSAQDLVITQSDPVQRIVSEIDGAPAARPLASLLGLKVEELTPQAFSKHPMMLQIGEDWYVRSIQKVNSDGSLSFFCAIDDGLPLTIASGVGLVETLAQETERIKREFSRVYLTLGIDCVLRRLEVQEKGLEGEVGSLFQRLKFAGFNSYGEQVHSLHVNQTLTAVVLGEKW